MKWITTVIMASALFSLIFLYNQKTKSSHKKEKKKPKPNKNYNHQLCGVLNPCDMSADCTLQDKKYLKGLPANLTGLCLPWHKLKTHGESPFLCFFPLSFWLVPVSPKENKTTSA